MNYNLSDGCSNGTYNIDKLSNMSNRIVIVSHIVRKQKIENAGPAHFLSQFLRENSIEHLFIKHPLDNFNEKTTVQHISSNTIVDIAQFNNSLLRNVFYNILFISKKKNRCSLYIGVDPLNAFCGIVLKQMKLVDNVIYYTADYAIRRFENPFKNKLYHFLDRTCARSADLVFNVSERICEVRRVQGVKESSIIYVPNISADYSKIVYPPIEEVNRYRLLLSTHITIGIEFELILNTIQNLMVKIPKIELVVIGDGPYKIQLEKRVRELNLDQHVKLYGQMDHDDVLKILLKGGIGLALYSDLQSWNYYRDSVKAREYVGCGIPTIMNMDVSPANELIENNCGFIANTQDDLENILCKLMLDGKYYAQIRNNAIIMAKKMKWSVYYGIISVLQ